MENTLPKSRRSATLRERVESRRARRENGLLSALFAPIPPQRSARIRRRVQAQEPQWQPVDNWGSAARSVPVEPPRPSRSIRERRVARHFQQLSHPQESLLDNLAQRRRLSEIRLRYSTNRWQRAYESRLGSFALHRGSTGGGLLGDLGFRWPSGENLLDDPIIRRLLPRLFLGLVCCIFVLFVWRGCGTFKGRAAAAPSLATATPTTAPTPKPGGKTSILILGSDKRQTDESFRTDVVLLLTIDPAKNSVSALSFPRDLVAKIPGYGDDRLNVVMQYGGFSLMQDTLEQSYGARPQYYFMTNFSGFTGLINSVGGIEIYASQPLADSCDLYWGKGGICEIEKGKQTMDGDTALWYIRSRHSSSDFDRLRRAQEVMIGIFNRFMNMDALVRLPELYEQYRGDIETNMPIDKVLPLLPVAMQVASHPSQVHRYTIPEEVTADWFMWNGARVLLPDYEKVKEIVKEAEEAR